MRNRRSHILREDMDGRSALRVLADEFAVCDVPLRLGIVLPEDRGTRFEESDVAARRPIQTLKRADVIGNPDLPAGRGRVATTRTFFNTTAFATPPAGTPYGNATYAPCY